jgi:hypothetical protein
MSAARNYINDAIEHDADEARAAEHAGGTPDTCHICHADALERCPLCKLAVCAFHAGGFYHGCTALPAGTVDVAQAIADATTAIRAARTDERRDLWRKHCGCSGPVDLCACIDRCGEGDDEDGCGHVRAQHEIDYAVDTGADYGRCRVPDCTCRRFVEPNL